MRIRQDLHARRKLELSLDLPDQVQSLDNAFVQVQDMATGQAIEDATAAGKFNILLITRHSALVL